MKNMVIIIAVVITIAFLVIMTISIMALWNWLMPEIFGLTEISFWHALALIFFVSLIASLFPRK